MSKRTGRVSSQYREIFSHTCRGMLTLQRLSILQIAIPEADMEGGNDIDPTTRATSIGEIPKSNYMPIVLFIHLLGLEMNLTARLASEP